MIENKPKTTPQGITYINNRAYEYQIFPEQYFTGSDVTLYFGDTWVDDVTGIEFTLYEEVTPIYGYASRTWDYVSRGKRLVNGTFRIAFKESGYLYTIFEHLGQLGDKTQPELAHMLAGEETPKWVGKCNDTIEDILTRYHLGINPREVPGFEISDMNIAAISRPPTTLKKGDTGEWVTKLQQVLKNKYGQYCLGSMSTAGWPNLSYTPRVYSDKVKKLQMRLKGYDIDPGSIDGYFGQKTRDAVGTFQSRAAITKDGIVGHNTRSVLSQAFTIDGIFGSVTRLVVCQVQKLNKLPVIGVVDSTLAAILWPDLRSSPSQGITLQPVVNMSAIESKMTQLEKEVWGRVFNPYAELYKKHNAYFYSGGHSQKLEQRGFDMYFVYGPLSHMAEIEGKVGEKVPFNTTVKTIRNVQLKALGQVIDASGEPIEEVYQFIAQDID